MDTVALVENQIDDGQKLLDLLEEEGFVVRAACWIKRTNEDRWSLYLATPVVDAQGTMAAYRQIGPIRHRLGEGWLTNSAVTVVGEKHGLVQDALTILRRFPHKQPIASPLSLIGGIPTDDVYVYPLSKVKVRIYGLFFPGAPIPTSSLSLEAPNPHCAFEVEGKAYPAETTQWEVAAPEGAILKRDKNGWLVLAWNRHGKPELSSADKVWSFAEERLYGFRFLSEPKTDSN